MDSTFELAGRKRYPIHNSSKTTQTEKNENENVGTTFTPLDSEVVFQGKLRYHNLKKAELGALLSALTFHNTQECFHNIGMAKSLGYGKLHIALNNSTNLIKNLKEFEMLMMQNIDNWNETQELKELFSMSTEQQNSKSSSLKYMELKEFAKLKNSTSSLNSYTQLENIKTIFPKSLVSDEDMQEIHERKKLMLQKIEERQAREKLKTEYLEVLESKNIQKIDSFITKYFDYENNNILEELKEKLLQAEQNNKFEKVNETAQNAWDGIHNPKYKASLQKSLASFIKKWEAKKNNKGSDFVLELVNQAKQQLK